MLVIKLWNLDKNGFKKYKMNLKNWIRQNHVEITYILQYATLNLNSTEQTTSDKLTHHVVPMQASPQTFDSTWLTITRRCHLGHPYGCPRRCPCTSLDVLQYLKHHFSFHTMTYPPPCSPSHSTFAPSIVPLPHSPQLLATACWVFLFYFILFSLSS